MFCPIILPSLTNTISFKVFLAKPSSCSMPLALCNTIDNDNFYTQSFTENDRSCMADNFCIDDQVSEVKGDDVVCVVKNSATLAGALFTLHVSQVHIDLPTLSDKDKEVSSLT